jgi:hypothetical protein
MKRAAIILVLVGLGALSAQGESIPLSSAARYALTPIDTTLTKADLVNIFPTNTASSVISLAQDGSSNADVGVRLRAIRALPLFCLPACTGTAPHQALVSLLEQVDDSTGTPILIKRAAIEALGITKSTDGYDVTLLTKFLNDSSRDLRAAAAFAMRDLCNQSAVGPLRARYNIEMMAAGVPQVRHAITAALRDLATCSN